MCSALRNIFYLHKWLSIYLIKCLHKLFNLYFKFLCVKKHIEATYIPGIFWKIKCITRNKARVKWLVNFYLYIHVEYLYIMMY